MLDDHEYLFFSYAGDRSVGGLSAYPDHHSIFHPNEQRKPQSDPDRKHVVDDEFMIDEVNNLTIILVECLY